MVPHLRSLPSLEHTATPCLLRLDRPQRRWHLDRRRTRQPAQSGSSGRRGSPRAIWVRDPQRSFQAVPCAAASSRSPRAERGGASVGGAVARLRSASFVSNASAEDAGATCWSRALLDSCLRSLASRARLDARMCVGGSQRIGPLCQRSEMTSGRVVLDPRCRRRAAPGAPRATLPAAPKCVAGSQGAGAAHPRGQRPSRTARLRVAQGPWTQETALRHVRKGHPGTCGRSPRTGAPRYGPLR